MAAAFGSDYKMQSKGFPWNHLQDLISIVPRLELRYQLVGLLQNLKEKNIFLIDEH